MKTVWVKGLEPDQQERIKSAFKASTDIRLRLTEICNGKLSTAMSTNKNQYDGASWPYEQADAIGYRRALEEIISLLEN